MRNHDNLAYVGAVFFILVLVEILCHCVEHTRKRHVTRWPLLVGSVLVIFVNIFDHAACQARRKRDTQRADAARVNAFDLQRQGFSVEHPRLPLSDTATVTIRVGMVSHELELWSTRGRDKKHAPVINKD